MDIFKQKRNLVITIVILVALNIITISLLWIGRPQRIENRRGGGQMRNKAHIQKLLKEELGFSKEQASQFLTIREKHIKNTRQINEEMRRIKRQMFDLAIEESNHQSFSDSLLNVTLEKQTQLEKAMFHYVIDIKELCNSEQKVKLKELMHKLFAPPPPPKQKGPPPSHLRGDGLPQLGN